MEYWEICGWFSWITPIIGAMLIPLLSKIGSKIRDHGAVLFSLLSMIMTLYLISLMFDRSIQWPLYSSYDWIIVPHAPILSKIKVGILIDPLSIIMANIVAIISFLIMVYSLGYMHGDPSLTRYWFFMNLFIGNMLLLVLSDNLFQMLFGWEGVGLCSYALIGFWYRDSKKDWLKCWVGEGEEAYPPSHCGLKAFLVTRFGDVVMLVGAFILLSIIGTLNFVEMSHIHLHSENIPLILLGFILLFFGPIGKSAQIPLLEWIPDAMAGPTTVSALIHAATMVKAGVFLTARIFPIVYLWSKTIPELSLFFTFVTWIGTLTAIIAALQAVVSTELKKVLAYSTMSQLGYMMMALGTGGVSDEYIIGYTGGIFHLMSHAMFKASLFLAAGSVLHAVGSRFLRHFGGLRKNMPYTFILMSVAALSLMGAPFISIGFWSKDMVLEAALISRQYIVFIIGVVTAFLTTFYTIRMISLTFLGKKSSFIVEREREGRHLHESPKIMLIPIAILVTGTLVLGVTGFYIKDLLEEIFHETMLPIHSYGKGETNTDILITTLSSIVAFSLGILAGYIVFIVRKISSEDVINRIKIIKDIRYILYRRLFLNKLYYIIVNNIISFSKKLLSSLELGIIDHINYVIAELFKKLSVKLLFNLEIGIIDHINYVIAELFKGVSKAIRYIHTGLLNYNIIGIILGMLLLLILLLSL